MKFYFIILAALVAQPVWAEDVLRNCFTEPGAQFFVHNLEEIAKEKSQAVLLLNEKKEVVGFINVTPKRNAKDLIKDVRVNQLSLCSSLETDDFYYTRGDAENLLKWAKAGIIEITQDEGLLEVETTLVKKQDYASLYKVEFKAYDVFNDDEPSEEDKKNPDYIEDWGLPKGKGTFYYYMPANWM